MENGGGSALEMSNLNRGHLRCSKKYPYGHTATPSPITRRFPMSTFAPQEQTHIQTGSKKEDRSTLHDERKKEISSPINQLPIRDEISGLEGALSLPTPNLDLSTGLEGALSLPTPNLDLSTGLEGALSLPTPNFDLTTRPLPDVPVEKATMFRKRRAPRPPPSKASLQPISEIAPPYGFRNKSRPTSVLNEGFYIEPSEIDQSKRSNLDLTHDLPASKVYGFGDMTEHTGEGDHSKAQYPTTVTTHM